MSDNKFLIICIWGISGIFLLPFENIFMINAIIYMIVSFILFIPFKDIINKIKRSNNYILEDNEVSLWKSIIDKANAGLKEWQDEYRQYTSPWTKPLTDEEYQLLDKIHSKYYGKDWYIVDSIGGTQATYIMYNDVKNKVR